MNKEENLKRFVYNRPKCIGAFGYGSKISTQLGYDENTKSQYDIIFIVDDMRRWHRLNSSINPQDYSFLSKIFLTSDKVKNIKGSTGMTFQSNIKEGKSVFKYGIIEYYDFLKALNTWNSFFVTGRFHKPIFPIKSNATIDRVIERNRINGLYTALLTLEDNKNSLVDVYESLCNLSYMGDKRMAIAENPFKVRNIVGGNIDFFMETYGISSPFFSTDAFGKISKNKNELLDNIPNLPYSVLEYLNSKNCNKKDLEEIRQMIITYLTNMNGKESKEQTIKGIKTNGITRSIRYAVPKVMKKVKSLSIKG